MEVEGGPVEEDSAGDGRREGETRWAFLRRMYSELGPFVVISFTYLLYTVTDGGVRTIVLFQAFQNQFSSFETALMFVLYELAGVVTNLLAGVAGARWGLKYTLLAGLALQIAGLGMLFGWRDSFTKVEAIIFVTVAQMLCGVAKDLVKVSGKAVTKLVTPEQKQERLFVLVSWITGWKNSLKGVGYFVGGALVQWSYFGALGVLMGIVIVALPWAVIGLSNKLGRVRRDNINMRSIFRKCYNLNVLSAARIFLFASRDTWFDVPLPFYLRAATGLYWERAAAAALLGGWIILYGTIQTNTPKWVSKPLNQSPPNKYVATLWAAISIVNPIFLGCFMQFSSIFKNMERGGMVAVVIVGIVLFAIIFAINSSVHSYLVMKYSDGDKVAMDVGFYYMANAVGRLMGTLVGGALYSFVGDTKSESLAACFWVSSGFIIVTVLITVLLDDGASGLKCGPCLTCIAIDGASDYGGVEETSLRKAVEAGDSEGVDDEDEADDEEDEVEEEEGDDEEDNEVAEDGDDVGEKRDDTIDGEGSAHQERGLIPSASRLEEDSDSIGIEEMSEEDVDDLIPASNLASNISTPPRSLRSTDERANKRVRSPKAFTWFSGLGRERQEFVKPRSKSHEIGQRSVRFSQSNTLIWGNTGLTVIERHADPNKAHLNTIRMPKFYVDRGILPASLIVDPSPKHHEEEEEEAVAIDLGDIVIDGPAGSSDYSEDDDDEEDEEFDEDEEDEEFDEDEEDEYDEDEYDDDDGDANEDDGDDEGDEDADEEDGEEGDGDDQGGEHDEIHDGQLRR